MLTEKKLKGQRVAILTCEGFEQSELFEPKKALEEAGAEVHVVSPKSGKIKAWDHNDWGRGINVDMTLEVAIPEEYHALMLPGGVINPDKLRMDKQAIEFVRHFVEAGKPIAAICHGPQTLIELDFVQGKRMTSWPSLKTDFINAGADWVDEEVVVDNGFVTSRKPDDLEAFNKKMIEEFAEGIHRAQTLAPKLKQKQQNSQTRNLQ